MNVAERVADWVVGVVAPKRAARRAHFRRMEADQDYAETFVAMMSARGYSYKSAETSGNATPWMDTRRSADGEISRSLPRLVSRSRELNRNDPIGSGLTKTFVSNVIGRGLKPQAKTGDAKKNKALEDVWNERKDKIAPAEDMTQAEWQRMLYGKTLEDGGVLVHAARADPGEPVWFEAIESDRLWSQPPFQRLRDGGSMRDGVKKDKHGRVKGYNILKAHPGDIGFLISAQPRDTIEIKADDNIRHLKRTTLARPGQSRGVPFTHAVLQDLRDIDLLIVASLKRTQIAASLAAFITSEASIDDLFETTAQKYGFRMRQDIQPGMMFKLFPGESVETLVPNFPTPEFWPFVKILARRIGAALGVSWQLVLKDFSEANYSSARTDLIEARQTFQMDVCWFIDRFLAWQWETVMVDAIVRGDPRLKSISIAEAKKVQWIHQGWRWIDPAKQAKATQALLDLGLTTLRDEAASQGKDYEELIEQQVKEEKLRQDLRKKHGIEPPPEKSRSFDFDAYVAAAAREAA